MSGISGKDAGGSCSDIMVDGRWDRTGCSSLSLLTTVEVDKNVVPKLMNYECMVFVCFCCLGMFLLLCRNMLVEKRACAHIA